MLAIAASAFFLATLFAAGHHNRVIAADLSRIGDQDPQSANDADLPPWPYNAWLTQDVAYIISPEERAAFLRLTSNEDRDNFIDQFWVRRNPHPESFANQFEDEHYRRIAFANEHFTSTQPGWMTDRGHVYIAFGKPDDVLSFPHGRVAKSAADSDAISYPFEEWRFKFLEGWGENISLKFVDTPRTNEYRLDWDDAKRGELFQSAIAYEPASENWPFVKIEVHIGAQMSPTPKFKDLSALVTARIVRAQLVFEQVFDIQPVTDCSAVATIRLDIPESELRLASDPDGTASAQVFARIIRPDGRILAIFEDQIDSKKNLAPGSYGEPRALELKRNIPLFYGDYQLDVAIEDPVNGFVGIEKVPLKLPHAPQN